MTEKEANLSLINAHNDIFIRKDYGEPAYAAVVLNRNKAYDYVIEVGMVKDEDFYLNSIINKDTEKLKNYGFTEQLIKKLYKSDNTDYFKGTIDHGVLKNIGFTDEEIEFLKFNNKTINNLSIKNLINLGHNELEANLITKGEVFIKSSSGEIDLLSYSKCCNNPKCNCHCAFYKKPKIERQNYIEGGISVSNKVSTKSGTLSCIFKMQDDSSNYGLSNSHVIVFDENNKKVCHPAIPDSPTNYSLIGTNIWNHFGDFLDVAVFKFDESVKIGNYLKNQTELKTPILAAYGMSVKKHGKTSGLTEGVILSINATVCVKKGKKNPIYFREQIMTSSMARPGDSGSLLVSKTNHACGLLFSTNRKKTRNFANHFHMLFNPKYNKEANLTFNKFINFKTT